jgi:hypothetical protein
VDQHRVAVRRRLRDLIGAERAGSTRLVLDHDRLAQPLRDIGAENPRHRIDRAARRIRNDEPDRPARVVLRGRRPCRDQRREARNQNQLAH